MTRYLVTIHSQSDRERATAIVAQAPAGSRVEVKAAKRSTDQNSKMWVMLSEIAMQKEHHGRKYTPEVWKALFLHGLQREIQLVPSLDGTEAVPITRTSDLSKSEMADLITFIDAWGAENGVTFRDQVAA